MNMPKIEREVRTPYARTLERAVEALKTEGFGVLTEIDVKDTLKRKIDVDFRDYKILGACNPALAHRALEANLDVGVLLPCNVIVYDKGDGTTVVSAVDPAAAIGSFGGPDLAAIADEVKAKLTRVLERLSSD